MRTPLSIARASRAREYVQTISRVKFAWEFVWTFSLTIFRGSPILQSSLFFLLTKPSIVYRLGALRRRQVGHPRKLEWGLPYPVVNNAGSDGRLLTKIP